MLPRSCWSEGYSRRRRAKPGEFQRAVAAWDDGGDLTHLVRTLLRCGKYLRQQVSGLQAV